MMMMLQMTGLSGSGKSTIALLVKEKLERAGIPCIVIDGDIYRMTICKDLGFSAADRRENIRRLAVEAEKFCREGNIAIIAAINPYEDIRMELKTRFNAEIIWVHCPLEELVKRDTKGLYKRALLKEDDPNRISNLTGVNDPFEIPKKPGIIIDTEFNDKETCSRKLLEFVLSRIQADL